MGLKEKLSNISQQISTEKQSEIEAREAEELKPTRLKINELEKHRLDLEMIKNSLDFKKDSNLRDSQGIGMKDYAETTITKKNKTRGELEEIAKENTEALEKLGVGNIDELATHPDFSEEEEIVAYKKALHQQEDLIMSDTKLKNRLVKLGIDMGGKNFSYESASQEIGRRLEDLNNELLSENLKTPEGREKIIDNLSEEFNKNTQNFSFEASSRLDKSVSRNNNPNEPDAYYQFALQDPKGSYHRDKLRVEFFDDKVVVPNFYTFNLVPQNFEEQVNKYGLEISSEALKKNYNNKVRGSFIKVDESGDKVKVMRDVLENDFDEVIEKINEKIDNIVDLKIAESEVMTKHGKAVYEVESMIKKIESEKVDASIILSEIANLQERLSPSEELIVSGVDIELVGKTKEYKRLSDEMNLKDKEIKDKSNELDKEQGSEPWLGKEKWRTKVANLKEELDKITQEKATLKGGYDKINSERFLYLDLKNLSLFSESGKLVKEFNASGKAIEVFENLKLELMKIVDKEVPEDAKRIYDKIKSLESSLSTKK